jgi:hypothetical protein
MSYSNASRSSNNSSLIHSRWRRRPHPGGTEHLAILEPVERGASGRRCDAIATGGYLGADDGLGGEANNDLPSNRIGPRIAGTMDQFTKQPVDLRSERRCRSRRSCKGVRECSDPIVEPSLSKVDQARDVAARRRCQDDTNGGHRKRCQCAAAEDHVNRAATATPIPVSERMDGLELSVGHGSLCDCRARPVVMPEKRARCTRETLTPVTFGVSEVSACFLNVHHL